MGYPGEVKEEILLQIAHSKPIEYALVDANLESFKRQSGSIKESSMVHPWITDRMAIDHVFCQYPSPYQMLGNTKHVHILPPIST